MTISEYNLFHVQTSPPALEPPAPRGPAWLIALAVGFLAAALLAAALSAGKNRGPEHDPPHTIAAP